MLLLLLLLVLILFAAVQLLPASYRTLLYRHTA